MTDREKVIKAVECRKNVHKRCGNPCEQIGNCEYAAWIRDSDGEPYYPCCCDTEKLCDDILFLLKEQETVEPIDLGLSADFITWGCPICKRWLDHDYKYCPYCGKAVKWN